MLIIHTISALRKRLSSLRRAGKTVGFVPTMGALHEGHLSLVRRARQDNDAVVVSIFVNPLQFGPNEDLRRYPRDIKKDSGLLRGTCDIVFAPSAQEIYPQGFCAAVEIKGFSGELCGRSRPGHFAGVTTVVAKLFNIVSPDRAYFGQKDAQQAAIIKKMVRDLNFGLQIKVLPIVREFDGLAMSSRNVYLSKSERQDAVILYQALKSAQRLVKSGSRDAARIKETLVGFISHTPGARIDYIEIVDKHTFKPVVLIEHDALLLLAIYIGRTRLIDNIVLKP